MSTKLNMVTFLSVLALCAALEMEAKSITVVNATSEPLCVAFVKTEVKSKTDLITGKDRYTALYVDKNKVSIQRVVMGPGSRHAFEAYERSIGTYDRVLWIAQAATMKGCERLREVDAFNKNLPANVQALEVGRKDRVYIVRSGNKFVLKSWTKELEEQANLLLQAIQNALTKSGQSWDDFKESAGEQWQSIKASFNKTYADLEKKAAQARRKVYKTKAEKAAEIAAQVEGAGEEGGGEGMPYAYNPDNPEGQVEGGRPSPLNPAWLERQEGFGIDNPPLRENDRAALLARQRA